MAFRTRGPQPAQDQNVEPVDGATKDAHPTNYTSTSTDCPDISTVSALTELFLQRREPVKCTLHQLAELLGVTGAHISHIEAGKRIRARLSAVASSRL